MIVIEDSWHGEAGAEFATRDEALDELRRLASLPWDQPPNLAPCTGWQTCGRRYELVTYDASARPWRELARTPALEISKSGPNWLL
jgi:hypothetical protein